MYCDMQLLEYNAIKNLPKKLPKYRELGDLGYSNAIVYLYTVINLLIYLYDSGLGNYWRVAVANSTPPKVRTAALGFFFIRSKAFLSANSQALTRQSMSVIDRGM